MRSHSVSKQRSLMLVLGNLSRNCWRVSTSGTWPSSSRKRTRSDGYAESMGR